MPSITQTTSATPKIIKPQTAAVTPQEQTTAPAGMQKEVRNYTTYIVKAGDNLCKIAEQAYKSGYNFVDVVRFNNIQNPGHIEVGQTILLPTVTPMPPTTPKEIVTTKGGQIEVGQTSSTMTSHVTFTGTSYTVQKGDTLWSISEKAYGDGFAWHMIERANSITNPTSLEIGTKLKIPRS
jgi:nucleoid-associated protein YgaU